MKKINIYEILKSAIHTYRNSFGKFLMFSSFISATSILTPLTNLFLDDNVLQWLAIPLILLSFAFLILSLKAGLGVQIYIAGAVNNTNLTMRASFAATRGKMWRYCGNIMLAGLLLIPIAIIGAFFSISNYPYSFLITLPYNCLILPLLFLLEPAVALEEEDTLKLKKAIRLIKGNYVRVLALVFFAQILWGIPGTVVLALFKGSPLSIFLLSTINSIIQIFIIAFSSAVKGVLYQQLSDKN